MSPTLDKADLSALYSMFKGEPGLRKSTQALSYPTPQYWFSWDRKMSSLLLPMKAFGVNPRDVEYDDYDDWSKPRTKLEQLQINCKYKTIICDSITSMADSALSQTMKTKKGVTRASGSAAGRNVGGIAVNEIEDFMAESSALMELISLTKDISSYHHVNVILIAHVIQAEYKSQGGVTHMSRTIVTAGKRVAPKIPGYCQEVYHFNIKPGFKEGAGGSYSLLTVHTGDDFARTSLPLPAEIIFNDEPIYPTYILPAINKLKGDITEESKPIPPTSTFTPITKEK
jgi:hypothetical protein